MRGGAVNGCAHCCKVRPNHSRSTVLGNLERRDLDPAARQKIRIFLHHLVRESRPKCLLVSNSSHIWLHTSLLLIHRLSHWSCGIRFLRHGRGRACKYTFHTLFQSAKACEAPPSATPESTGLTGRRRRGGRGTIVPNFNRNSTTNGRADWRDEAHHDLGRRWGFPTPRGHLLDSSGTTGAADVEP